MARSFLFIYGVSTTASATSKKMSESRRVIIPNTCPRWAQDNCKFYEDELIGLKITANFMKMNVCFWIKKFTCPYFFYSQVCKFGSKCSNWHEVQHLFFLKSFSKGLLQKVGPSFLFFGTKNTPKIQKNNRKNHLRTQ